MIPFRFNLVHPVPYFDNLTALEEVLDRMEELNLWLMYDMRWYAVVVLSNSHISDFQKGLIKVLKPLLNK